MIDQIKRKAAELTLVYAAPMFTNAKESSRLAGLQRNLQKVVQPYLKVLNILTQSEKNAITKCIDSWGERVDWWNASAPTATLISFYLDIIEYSPIKYNPKILEALVLIAEHLEEANLLVYSACVDATKVAAEWKEAFPHNA